MEQELPEIKCECGSADTALKKYNQGFSQFGLFHCYKCKKDSFLPIPMVYFVNGGPAMRFYSSISQGFGGSN